MHTNYVIRQLSLDDLLALSVQRLLTDVYVDEGFTEPELAAERFPPSAVFARGDVLGAVENLTGRLVGLVVVVPFESPARKLANPGEAELHLLAVAKEHRFHGIGGLLMRQALSHATSNGFESMVLWTQPEMTAAHRLYEKNGFRRETDSDFETDGRCFWVFRADNFQRTSDDTGSSNR